MPIDSSIALQVRGPADPLESYGKALSLKSLLGQQQMQQMQLQQAQEDQQAQKTLADLYRSNIDPSGQVNRQGLLQSAAQRGLGTRIPGLQKGFADADKATADVAHTGAQTDELKFKVAKQKLDASGAALSSLLSRPNVTHDDVIGTIQGMVQQGMMDPAQGAQMVRALPGRPEALRPFLLQKGLEVMDASKRIDMLTPKAEVRDTGGAVQSFQTNQLTGEVTPGAVVARKTMTPGEIATDSRSRERLAFDKEQAGVANGVGGSISLPGFGKAPPGYMWDSTTQPPQLKSIKGGPADSGAKPSAEVQRQIGGVLSFDKDLSALEEALKDFNPRSTDQLSTEKRARIQSLSKQAQLSAKEAAALGALSGPDMELLTGILNDPTSMRGAVSGSSGIAAQIAEARKGNQRRVQSLGQQYGPRSVEGLPPELKGGATAPSGWSINKVQ